MKVLMIGGTGLISTATTQLAVEKGIDLYLLNRGNSKKPLPMGVHSLKADINDLAQVKKVLKGLTFDVVVNWTVFTPDHGYFAPREHSIRSE